jgi:hypothetical protein
VVTAGLVEGTDCRRAGAHRENQVKKQATTLLVAAMALGGIAAGSISGAGATPTTVGSCTGLTSVVKASPALTNVQGPVTFSGKGGAGGSCSFSSPVTGGGSVTKWGWKITSPQMDCIGDGDVGEYPQNGKLSISFAATKFDAYVRAEANVNPNAQDISALVGIVTTGDAVGMSIYDEIYMDPVIKDKTESIPVAGLPGYSLDLANAGGCADSTGATPAAITGVIAGDGASRIFTSETAAGATFTYGL